MNVRDRYSARGELSGAFEILAINAGVGNGWEFGEGALRDSLPLWDHVDCFVDHGESTGERSVKDLAGVCHSPQWDETRRGIRLQLKAAGPMAGVLADLGRQMLASSPAAPRAGFSADLLFTAQGKKVEKILRVFSVDLVMSPARGGVFLRALDGGAGNPEQINLSKGVTMDEQLNPNTPVHARLEQGAPVEAANAARQAVEAPAAAVQTALQAGSPPRQLAPAADSDAIRRVESGLYSALLETTLAASRLPLRLNEQVRRRFAGQVYDPQELKNAVDEARQLVSDLTGGLVVNGPGRVSGMFDTRDQLQAAVDDLLGAKREKSAEGLKVAPLQGIRELYLTLTGDVDMHGGYYPERARLATTADFSGLVKNALNKIIVDTWEQLGRAGYDWWRRVTRIEHFGSLNSITGTLLGTVGALPQVSEGAEYTELPVGDSPETGSFKKYGGYIPLTLELIDRDETRKIRAYAVELANAGLRNISGLVAAVFTDASGVGPTLADGGALFNASAVTAGGGHANLSTAALSASAWEAACAAVYNQPLLVKNASGYYGSGSKQAINPRYLLAPRGLALTARQILLNDWMIDSGVHAANLLKGTGEPLIVPEWTNAANWAAVCDPAVAPAIYVGERFGLAPEIFIAGDALSPAVFTNDEHRLKVRHFIAVWVNDFRPLHKSNV